MVSAPRLPRVRHKESVCSLESQPPKYPHPFLSNAFPPPPRISRDSRVLLSAPERNHMASPAKPSPMASAQLSTGPRSAAGRDARRAKRNPSRTHRPQPRHPRRQTRDELLDALHESLLTELDPKGAVETITFRELLHAAWNLERYRRLEAELLRIRRQRRRFTADDRRRRRPRPPRPVPVPDAARLLLRPSRAPHPPNQPRPPQRQARGRRGRRRSPRHRRHQRIDKTNPIRGHRRGLGARHQDDGLPGEGEAICREFRAQRTAPPAR